MSALTLATARRPRSARGRRWVSKSDLVTYVRCPYAFSLLDRGEITREEAMSELGVLLAQEGVAFEQDVQAALPVVEVADQDQLKELLEQGLGIMQPPLIENTLLEIYGRPDGVEPQGGDLVPIEIKSHKHVQPLDELELAFYWLLLDPMRASQGAVPRGVLLLREAGLPVRHEVEISARRIEQVHSYLRDIRLARRRPPAPVICPCHVCRHLRGAEVVESARERHHPSLLHGVGWHFSRALEEIGITSYDQLLERDPWEVSIELRSLDYAVGVSMVRSWQQHARAYQLGAPVFFGAGFPVPHHYLVLDLEYLCGPWGEHIWLAGVGDVDLDRTRVIQLWSEPGPTGERRLLRELGELLASRSGLPLVTYSGTSADLPQLSAAAERLGLEAPQAGFEHLDLYWYAVRSLRLPEPRLGLKDLATYFAIPRGSEVSDGFEAQDLYLRWAESKDPGRRRDIKSKLLAYNRDDLETLVAVTERFRWLAAEHPPGPAATAGSGAGWE